MRYTRIVVQQGAVDRCVIAILALAVGPRDKAFDAHGLLMSTMQLQFRLFSVVIAWCYWSHHAGEFGCVLAAESPKGRLSQGASAAECLEVFRALRWGLLENQLSSRYHGQPRQVMDEQLRQTLFVH